MGFTLLIGDIYKMIEQIKEMMKIQNKLNNHLDKKWMKKDWNFSLASDVEMVEAIEHYGWKWWKHQECDIDQVKMELVDIWHFLLSGIIVEKMDPERVKDALEEGFQNLNDYDFIRKTTMFLKYHTFVRKIQVLAGCMDSIDMSFDELRTLYLGKSILNLFRWNNGYNDGTYIKVWDGLEDNEYLTSILMCHPDAPADEIYNMLEERYRKIV